MPSDNSEFDIEINRRLLGKMLGGGLLGASMLGATGAQAQTEPKSVHKHPAGPANAPSVSMLIYPGMVLLDLVGPLTVFSIMRSKIELVWKDTLPVATDCKIPVSATHDFSNASTGLDIFCIPGGTMGSVDCMNDPVVMDYVRRQGESSAYVTSVCTGSMVLAAAGLLKGYRATSLWALTDYLELMGAEYVDQRVVIDRNRITAGGVTAGIDFGLMLAAKLVDEETAKRIQLILEYAPEPPFDAGTPEGAGVELTAKTKARRVGMDAAVEAAARAAGKRLNI